MRPPETGAPARERGHQDDTDQAHSNATAPTAQVRLDSRIRAHAARCAICAHALAAAERLCRDGERLAEAASRYAERRKHVTGEARARRRDLERWGAR
jgi:hypothetical protein